MRNDDQTSEEQAREDEAYEAYMDSVVGQNEMAALDAFAMALRGVLRLWPE